MVEGSNISRPLLIKADVHHLERMRKEGHTAGFTVYCDEGERHGGDGSAPTPLGYFALSIGF